MTSTISYTSKVFQTMSDYFYNLYVRVLSQEAYCHKKLTKMKERRIASNRLLSFI